MSQITEFDSKVFDSVADALAAGKTLAQATNLKQENLEGLYALAYNLYSSGNFKDAETVFRALCIYDHKDIRYWMGLGGCRQALGKYQEAIEAYSMGGSVAALLSNPEPFFYAAKCFLKLGDKENAIDTLRITVEIGDKDKPENAVCHTKARQLLELLTKAA